MRMVTPLRSKILLASILLAGTSLAETSSKAVYVESFRQGPTQVPEYAMVANLDADTPTYTAKIKDKDDNKRFQLSILPHHAGEGDAHIISWRVQLVDLKRPYLGNVLVSTKPPDVLTDTAGDRAWWLDPSSYAIVPLNTKRVFKVEDFYCVVEVKDYHRVVPERLWLDSMRVEVQFTGKDPRSN
jgi:hypothetical protein